MINNKLIINRFIFNSNIIQQLQKSFQIPYPFQHSNKYKNKISAHFTNNISLQHFIKRYPSNIGIIRKDNRNTSYKRITIIPLHNNGIPIISNLFTTRFENEQRNDVDVVTIPKIIKLFVDPWPRSFSHWFLFSFTRVNVIHIYTTTSPSIVSTVLW